MNKDEKVVIDAFSSFNWLNILPTLRGKRVLFCGCKKNLELEAVMRLNHDSMAYLNLFDPRVKRKIMLLAQRHYDICIIGTEVFDVSVSMLQFKSNLQLLFDLLNDQGLLFLSFPSGLRALRIKFCLKNILRSIGFIDIRSFLCKPSCVNPSTIFSFSEDQNLTFELLFDHYLKDFHYRIKIRQKAKTVFKYIVARFVTKVNPFTGLMVVSFKSMACNVFTNDEELARRNIGECDETCKYFTVWLGKPLKHIGLFYGGKKEKELIAVCKRTLSSAYRSSSISEEHDKLTLLSSYHDEFKRKRIQIPEPICLDKRGVWIVAIETAIYGKSLENYKWRLASKILIGNFAQTLNELVDIQMYLQNFLSIKHGTDYPKISDRYFTDTLGTSYGGFSDSRRINSYADNIQHGDFTDLNIVYNSRDKMWGIIDWEWSASGFPFLFDLFYLFLSLEFREKKGNDEPLLSHYFSSMTDTFFCNNWYSECLKNVVQKYCVFFSLDAHCAYEYFLDFLLFHYNKYYFDYKNYDYAALYKKNIFYAINNRHKFIV